MKNITIAIPEAYAENIQELIELGFAPSRSESIRVAITQFIKQEAIYLDEQKYPLNNKSELKIITINVPKSFLSAMDSMKSCFPSRSELIRIALREWLIRENKIKLDLIKIREKVPPSPPKDIYIQDLDENGEVVLKHYKVKRPR